MSPIIFVLQTCICGCAVCGLTSMQERRGEWFCRAQMENAFYGHYCVQIEHVYGQSATCVVGVGDGLRRSSGLLDHKWEISPSLCLSFAGESTTIDSDAPSKYCHFRTRSSHRWASTHLIRFSWSTDNDSLQHLSSNRHILKLKH